MPSDYYTKQPSVTDGNVAYANDVNRINNETDAAFSRVLTDTTNLSNGSAASQAWALGASGTTATSGSVIPPVYGGDGSTYSSLYYAKSAQSWSSTASGWAAAASASVTGSTVLVGSSGVSITTTGTPSTATFAISGYTAIPIGENKISATGGVLHSLSFATGASNYFRVNISPSSSFLKLYKPSAGNTAVVINSVNDSDFKSLLFTHTDGTSGSYIANRHDNLYLNPGATGSTYTNSDSLPFASGTHSVGSSSYRWDNGWFVSGNTLNAWAGMSDEREKNVKDIGDVSWVYLLNPIMYDWKNKSVGGSGDHYGFSAQDLEANVPKKDKLLVRKKLKKKKNETDPDDHEYGIVYTEMIPVLTKLIQDQKQLIDDLTSRIEALEAA
jgi:hypothetical protein